MQLEVLLALLAAAVARQRCSTKGHSAAVLPLSSRCQILQLPHSRCRAGSAMLPLPVTCAAGRRPALPPSRQGLAELRRALVLL